MFHISLKVLRVKLSNWSVKRQKDLFLNVELIYQGVRMAQW